MLAAALVLAAATKAPGPVLGELPPAARTECYAKATGAPCITDGKPGTCHPHVVEVPAYKLPRLPDGGVPTAGGTTTEALCDPDPPPKEQADGCSCEAAGRRTSGRTVPFGIALGMGVAAWRRRRTRS